MRLFSIENIISVWALALGGAIVVSLFADVEIRAQGENFRIPPLIKESQKTDPKEKRREEIGELDKLIAREPQNIEAYKYRATNYYELAHLEQAADKQAAYEQAATDYSRLIVLAPQNLKFRLSRASIYRETKQYQKALTDLDYVIRRAPHRAGARGFDAYDAYLSRYLIHFDLNEYEKAIIDVSDILKFSPKDEWAYQSRAALYLLTKKYKKALADYTKIIKLDSRSTYGYYGRAEVYKIIGKPEKAAAEIKAAEKIIRERGY